MYHIHPVYFYGFIIKGILITSGTETQAKRMKVTRRKDRQLVRCALDPSGFRWLGVDIYMERGGSEVRLWSFCVCGGVVGSTPCSLSGVLVVGI